jgi:hypothetical protein
MAWVKLDDQFFINKKARAAGLEGRALAAASWCYCAMQRNDGIFPADDVAIIAAMAGVPQDIGDRLLEVGLWHRVGDQIEVHDYLEHNLSNEQMIARSEKAAKAAAARHATSSAPSTATSRPASQPIPSPSPSTSSSSSSSSDLDRLPAELWTTIADKKMKTAKVTNNPTRYRAKVIENDKRDLELVARAVQIMERYDVSTPYLAECLIGGTLPRAEYLRKAAS